MARPAPFDLQQFFQSLGDNTRLPLLSLMGEQEVCVCYFVELPPHIGATQILRQTLESLKEDKAMQARRARLTKACCAPARYDLEGAPLPVVVVEPCCEVG